MQCLLGDIHLPSSLSKSKHTNHLNLLPWFLQDKAAKRESLSVCTALSGRYCSNVSAHNKYILYLIDFRFVTPFDTEIVIFLIASLKIMVFPTWGNHWSDRWAHPNHISHLIPIFSLSLSLYKYGDMPAGRNIHRCQKTSTHHDLIRGCCWKNSWPKQCGRGVSSKCAASAKKL